MVFLSLVHFCILSLLEGYSVTWFFYAGAIFGLLILPVVFLASFVLQYPAGFLACFLVSSAPGQNAVSWFFEGAIVSASLALLVLGCLLDLAKLLAAFLVSWTPGPILLSWFF
jgi:hypothetical protein